MLLYYAVSGNKSSLWILPLAGDKASNRKPFSFVQTTFNASEGQFSPDGRWIAYSSDESQRGEVYVAPFPGPGGKRQVSSAGGSMPVWGHNGKELFYRATDGNLTSAEIRVQGSVLDVGAIRPLFPMASAGVATGYNYDVSADGQSFLVRTLPLQTSNEPLTLVQNWTAILRNEMKK